MNFVPGIPVPIGGIDKELGRLWEESGERKTRASLVNLAVYNEKAGSLETNSGIIRGIAGEHAMRAILIEADPKAAGSAAEAWISMHCYPRGTHGGAVCSEQISFRLGGEAARSLQSVVFSHLDSDLPLALWWQADFRPPVDGKLWSWVDRLLFDSRHWKQPAEQFELISSIIGLPDSRTVLCDLNWARSLPVRQAIASLFDAPSCHEELRRLRSLRITHAPGYRTTALLLTGWLADRLGWRMQHSGEAFVDASGATVGLSLGTADGSSISDLRLDSEGGASFHVRRDASSEHYVTEASGTCIPASGRMIRAPREETREILLAELARGGRHPLYTSAIRAIAPLWR